MSLPLQRLRTDQSGAISVSALLWLAVAGVLIYALLAAYYGEVDRFGRVTVPGQGTVDLPAGASDISYAEQAVEGVAEVQVPADLELEVTSVATGEGLELDPLGGGESEKDGEILRAVGSVDPPAAGLYKVQVLSREAASRPNPQLAFGESPFGAFGDRLSRVVDLLSGTIGIVLAALVVAAIAVPRVLRGLGR